jgi:hypothetical protein
MNMKSKKTPLLPRCEEARAVHGLLSHFENFFLASWRLGG